MLSGDQGYFGKNRDANKTALCGRRCRQAGSGSGFDREDDLRKAQYDNGSIFDTALEAILQSEEKTGYSLSDGRVATKTPSTTAEGH